MPSQLVASDPPGGTDAHEVHHRFGRVERTAVFDASDAFLLLGGPGDLARIQRERYIPLTRSVADTGLGSLRLRMGGGSPLAMWDEFERRHPQPAQRALLTAEALPPQAPIEELRERMPGYSLRAVRGAASSRTAPNGIFGVGAWLPTPRAKPLAAVFVLRSVEPNLRPLKDSPYLRSLLPLRDVLDDVYIVPVGRPKAFASAIADGTPIRVGARRGAAGTRATLDGRSGFLTAGHTAQLINAVVRDEVDEVVGRVVRTLRRGSPFDNSPAADVAFVSDRVGESGQAQPRSTRSIREGDKVTFPSSATSNQTWIRGLSPVYLLRPEEPGWGQIAITADPVAVAGDSGASVIGEDGVLVGHVVGGTGDGYTIIQDAPFQLKALGARAIA